MAEYVISPLADANGSKCEKCKGPATHFITIKEKKKMFCCTKQVCIFSLIRREE